MHTGNGDRLRVLPVRIKPVNVLSQVVDAGNTVLVFIKETAGDAAPCFTIRPETEVEGVQAITYTNGDDTVEQDKITGIRITDG